jgi:hypothetical protein
MHRFRFGLARFGTIAVFDTPTDIIQSIHLAINYCLLDNGRHRSKLPQQGGASPLIDRLACVIRVRIKGRNCLGQEWEVICHSTCAGSKIGSIYAFSDACQTLSEPWHTSFAPNRHFHFSLNRN